MSDFVSIFAHIVAGQGRMARWSPATVLEVWDDFIGNCETCYDFTLYEYENELSVRDLIERVLLNTPPSEQRDAFASAVAALDARFQAVVDSGPIVHPHDSRWWRSRLPAYAGKELAEDAKLLYGVSLSCCKPRS